MTQPTLLVLVHTYAPGFRGQAAGRQKEVDYGSMTKPTSLSVFRNAVIPRLNLTNWQNQAVYIKHGYKTSLLII